MRNVVKYSPPILAPPEGALDDWAIAADLALRIAPPDLDLVRRAGRRLLRDLPDRAVDILLRTGRYRGLSLAALRAAPHGIDLGPLRPARADKVRTPDGRVRLAPPVLMADLPRLERWIDGEHGAGLVMAGRRHVLGDNSWLHNERSLVKGPERARLMMHPDDGARLGLADGQEVRVRSRVGAVVARLALSDQMMAGVVSLPHGFGHAAAAATLRVAGKVPGPSANALTDELLIEPLVGASILNGVPVEVEAM